MPLRLVLFVAAALTVAAIARAEAPPSAGAPADGNPVVARVNGQEFHRSDLVLMQRTLPAQLQSASLERAYPTLIEQLVTGKLLEDAARAERIDEEPEV